MPGWTAIISNFVFTLISWNGDTIKDLSDSSYTGPESHRSKML
jgi:hypothetical protein